MLTLEEAQTLAAQMVAYRLFERFDNEIVTIIVKHLDTKVICTAWL